MYVYMSVFVCACILYECIYVCICVCIDECICVCVRERERMVLDTSVTKTTSALSHGKEGLSGKAHLPQKMLTLTREKVTRRTHRKGQQTDLNTER